MLEYWRTLIADDARTLQYFRALEVTLRNGDTVLDLGCGTGILSFLACSLGAGRVIAVDHADVADAAELVASHLDLAERVSVLHQHSTSVSMSDRADVLVTETIGMLGLDEGILGSVIDARQRLLAANARIIPRTIAVCFAPLDCPEIYDRHVAWWSSPRHGVDFSPLRLFASNTVFPVTLQTDWFLCEGKDVVVADLETVTESAASGEATFVASRAGRLHGFGGWFETTLAPGVHLSSLTDGTNWSQGFLPLQQPIDVEQGARISLSVESRSNGRIWRWRGHVSGPTEIGFDQCSVFSSPPCRKHRGR